MAELTFAATDASGVRHFTTEGRHANARLAIGNAVAIAVGINPQSITIVRDVLDPLKYELALTIEYEAWIKGGSAIVSRNNEGHVAETIVNGFLMALRNAEADPRPKRRRFP
ncbi:MAG: hypothetical protein AAB533_03220 [Patescibacteria group bacterium]